MTLALLFAAACLLYGASATVACKRLLMTLAGREKPPSVEEMMAHAAAHPWAGDTTAGRWLVRAPESKSGAECSAVVVLRRRSDGRVFCGMPSGAWVELPPNPSGQHEPGSRWWPLDRNGRPCAWSDVEVSHG